MPPPLPKVIILLELDITDVAWLVLATAVLQVAIERKTTRQRLYKAMTTARRSLTALPC